jgi:beta-barrel assembly-enhancing protease
MMRRLALLAATLLGVAPGWAAQPVFSRPPYAGAYQPQGTDERGLWMELGETERSVRELPGLVRDARLTEFVRSVLCQTVGRDRCGSVRTYIIQDNTFNASMAPNGMMIVHTGLLVRLHSEAELAAILGHEFAHFEQRHTLRRLINTRSGTDLMAWMGIVGAATNVSTAREQKSIALSFFSFSRANESESDLLSTRYVRASRYRIRGSAVWRRVLDEYDADRRERGLRKLDRQLPNLTDTHPTDLQRIDFHARLEQELGPVGEDGVESYRTATAAIMPALLDSLVKGNQYAAASYVITARGEALGWDAPLTLARGELYRQRGGPRNMATARDLYRSATTMRGAPPEAWRGLGLSAMRLGDKAEGRSALIEYLRRAPGARDAATIRLVLEN